MCGLAPSPQPVFGGKTLAFHKHRTETPVNHFLALSQRLAPTCRREIIDTIIGVFLIYVHSPKSQTTTVVLRGEKPNTSVLQSRHQALVIGSHHPHLTGLSFGAPDCVWCQPRQPSELLTAQVQAGPSRSEQDASEQFLLLWAHIDSNRQRWHILPTRAVLPKPALRSALLSTRGFNLLTTAAIAADLSRIPEGAGVYAFLLNPQAEPATRALLPSSHVRLLKREVLYVGSSRDLRGRLKRHLCGGAACSTLRMSLGVILQEELQLEAQGTPGQHYFGWGSKEERLTCWMTSSLDLAYRMTDVYSNAEVALIGRTRPPLNITYQRQSGFAQELMARRMSKSARWA